MDLNAARRVPSLTSLRFFAAFAVLGFHAAVSSRLLPTGGLKHTLAYAFAGGACGVSFFFVLSGFVLTWTARRDDPVTSFWRRRAARVYPNHLVTWALVGAALVAAHKEIGAIAAAASAGLVQAWVPVRSVYFGMNTPSWSLSCEAFFYLMFPLVFRLVDRCSVRTLQCLAVVLAFLPAAFAAVSYALPEAIGYWLLFVFPPVRMVEFVLGVTLARLVRAKALPGIPVVPAAVLAAAALIASGRVSWHWNVAAIAVIPASLLICAAVQRDVSGRPAAVLHRGWLIALGEASFALYLVHQIVIRVMPQAHSAARGVELLTFVTVVSVGWALLQYRFFEAPAYRRLSRPAVPVAPSAPPGRPEEVVVELPRRPSPRPAAAVE